jgi:hypothetical protein
MKTAQIIFLSAMFLCLTGCGVEVAEEAKDEFFVIPDVNLTVHYSLPLKLASENMHEEIALIDTDTKNNLTSLQRIYNIRFPFRYSSNRFGLSLADDLPAFISTIPVDIIQSKFLKMCDYFERARNSNESLVLLCREFYEPTRRIEFFYIEKTYSKPRRLFQVAIFATEISSLPAVMVSNELDQIVVPEFTEINDMKKRIKNIIGTEEQKHQMQTWRLVVDNIRKVMLPERNCTNLGQCDITVDPDALSVTRMEGSDPSKLPTTDSSFIMPKKQ